MRRLLVLFLLAIGVASAQSFTTISDTLKAPDGVTNFDGTLTISWPTYTITGVTTPAGSMRVVVINGAVNISLRPTDRMTCDQTCVYVVSYLSQGQGIVAQWKVPTSSSSVVLSTVLQADAATPIYGTTGSFSGTVTVLGHTTFEGVTSTGASGTGNLVYGSALPLIGTTGSIGGGALAAGVCTAETTITVTGATTSMVAVASPAATDGTLANATWPARVSAANTVAVKVCAGTAVTPIAETYNVRVIQ